LEIVKLAQEEWSNHLLKWLNHVLGIVKSSIFGNSVTNNASLRPSFFFTKVFAPNLPIQLFPSYSSRGIGIQRELEWKGRKAASRSKVKYGQMWWTVGLDLFGMSGE
jgi:hypothetical protein